MTDLVIRHAEGTITTLTLNRPDKRNALSADLVEALLSNTEAAATDGTETLILRGNGKAFCAGFDFTGIEDQSDADLVYRFIRIEQLLQAVWHAPYMTIALAHGACYGAGADLVCAAAHRVAASGTRFRMPGRLFGISLGNRRLAEVIGEERAELVLDKALVISADEALADGLLSNITEPEDWSGSLEAVAGQKPPARQDHRDRDLATLVNSAATPGLRRRILQFLSG